MTIASLDPAVADFYHRTPEESRLEQGAFRLEAARTRELIQRYAPPPPAIVLDVGGAAGAYAFWLAARGYEVHLIDPVRRLIGEAERRNQSEPHRLASVRIGDARALEVADASADLVLLLGPLYHLTERSDRLRALHEARRVLQPGGRLLAAAISRIASALDGFSRGLFADPRFEAIVAADLRDGQHRNATERLDYFTTAYFHRPDDLAGEISEAGLTLTAVHGIEGPAWILPDIVERMDDPDRVAEILRVARLLDLEPSVLGMSAHLLAAAQKPEHLQVAQSGGTVAAGSFRPAVDADVERILEFMRALNQEDGATPFQAKAAEPALRDLLGQPDRGRVWLIEREGVAAGYLVLTWGYSLEFHGRDAFIDELYVAPAHRGLGLGRQAVALAEAACRAYGVGALHLEVETGNERAHSLYRQSGFAERGLRLMTKRLLR